MTTETNDTSDTSRASYRPGPAGEATVQEKDGRWTLIFVRTLRHPPEKVWRLLTDPQESGAAPYMGVGYTGLYGRSGWGFSADFGLVGTQTDSRVKLGRSVTGYQNPDEALREMRLSPLLQLGVSYSF